MKEAEEIYEFIRKNPFKKSAAIAMIENLTNSAESKVYLEILYRCYCHDIELTESSRDRIEKIIKL